MTNKNNFKMNQKKGHLNVMKLLIENGAKVDGTQLDGKTPLYLATRVRNDSFLIIYLFFIFKKKTFK